MAETSERVSREHGRGRKGHTHAHNAAVKKKRTKRNPTVTLEQKARGRTLKRR